MSKSAPAKDSDDAPLPRTRLGHELLHARLLVVEGLRHRSIGLVRARRAHAFILVIDLRSRPERLLEAIGTVERGGPPHAVDVAHRFGDGDLALRTHLLHDKVHREERREVVRPHRLQRAGVQGRRRHHGEVRGDVVPVFRHALFAQNDLAVLCGHGALPVMFLRMLAKDRANRKCAKKHAPAHGRRGDGIRNWRTAPAYNPEDRAGRSGRHG